MKGFLVKLYQRATLPLYERLRKELVWLLQDTSRAYVEQHEQLNITLIDELTKLSIRLDRLENCNINGSPVSPAGPAEQQLDGHTLTKYSENVANNNERIQN